MTHVTRKVQRISPAAVYSQGRLRSVIICVEPPGDLVGFRLKGTRRTWTLPVSWCYLEACRATLAREKAEKRKARKAVGATGV